MEVRRARQHGVAVHLCVSGGCKECVRYRLTKAEREAVRLACRGLDNAGIAKALGKSEETVANQLPNVYEKLSEWLDYPEHDVGRSVPIAEFAPYFVLAETEG